MTSDPFLEYPNWFFLAQIRQQVRFYVSKVYLAHSRSAFLNQSATQEELMLLEIPLSLITPFFSEKSLTIKKNNRNSEFNSFLTFQLEQFHSMWCFASSRWSQFSPLSSQSRAWSHEESATWWRRRLNFESDFVWIFINLGLPVIVTVLKYF